MFSILHYTFKMDEIEKFRKSDLEQQVPIEHGELNVNLKRSDRIVINDTEDLEYSDYSAGNESVRKEVLSDIQEEEEQPFIDYHGTNQSINESL